MRKLAVYHSMMRYMWRRMSHCARSALGVDYADYFCGYGYLEHCGEGDCYVFSFSVYDTVCFSVVW
jgi:hypothetical protein